MPSSPAMGCLLNSFNRRWRVMLVLCLGLACQLPAQNFKGRILDEKTKEPLPFAIIAVGQSNNGTTADLDGNFTLTLRDSAKYLHIQVLGYEKKAVPLAALDSTQINTIRLKSSGIQLGEIVITPRENPAIPIIREVIRRMPLFDIENLPHYICRTYAKTYFAVSDQYGHEINSFADDTSKSGHLMDNSYLLFMESVTEKKYRYKNQSQEKVLASRMSGFKSAPFGALASQLQSFTFYNDNLEVLGIRYLNPLTNGTFKRYQFEITDTVLSGTDTTILIRFYPKKNVTFKALKGVLYINRNQYVLANVLAEPSVLPRDGNGVKIQQLYEKIDSVHWFPKQANTEILFYNFSAGAGKDTSVHEVIKGVSRLYVREVSLDSVFRIRNRSLTTYNQKGFDEKGEDYWQKEREDSLTAKEQKTYRVIDSIGKALKIDKKLQWLTALSTGQLQIGYINLDLTHILRVNRYEALRLGAGLGTSNKLSRYFSVGGYAGYGFGDKAWKYGGYARLNFNHRQSTFLQLEAAKEVYESAGTSFLLENTSFLSTDKIRTLLINRMDKVRFGKASFNVCVFNFIRASAYMQIQQRISPFGYGQVRDGLLVSQTNQFTFNEVGLQLKIWPGEKFTEMLDQYISMGSRWPAFFLNLSQGMSNTLLGYTGSFNYTKIDLRIDQQLRFKVKGFFAWQIQAGKVFGNVPYSLQYNNKGSRVDQYQISAEKTFETMYLNEFTSTQYAALFLAINSGKLIRPNKYCNPELELVHNYGIGRLDNRANITGIVLNDISKGFSEAGLRIKNIIHTGTSSFGLGVFYRYGAYANPEQSKNFVYKGVFSYTF